MHFDVRFVDVDELRRRFLNHKTTQEQITAMDYYRSQRFALGAQYWDILDITISSDNKKIPKGSRIIYRGADSQITPFLDGIGVLETIGERPKDPSIIVGMEIHVVWVKASSFSPYLEVPVAFISPEVWDDLSQSILEVTMDGLSPNSNNLVRAMWC